MNTLQICPPDLSDVATLPSEIKKSFFNVIIHMYSDYLRLPQKKTNSNCCTAALAVYLLLFSASYYLHSPSRLALRLRHATGGADMLRL